MQAKAYLFFNGNAGAAIESYSRIFGADPVTITRMGDGPPMADLPPERKDWIMHCELPIGDGSIYLSDDYMANSPAMDGCSIMVSLPTAAEAKTIFDQLAEGGGQIRMAWAPTFWSAGFGTLTDRFGVRWMVGCDEQQS